MPYGNSGSSDQPVSLCSLIRAPCTEVHQSILQYPEILYTGGQGIPQSDCAHSLIREFLAHICSKCLFSGQDSYLIDFKDYLYKIITIMAVSD